VELFRYRLRGTFPAVIYRTLWVCESLSETAGNGFDIRRMIGNSLLSVSLECSLLCTKLMRVVAEQWAHWAQLMKCVKHKSTLSYWAVVNWSQCIWRQLRRYVVLSRQMTSVGALCYQQTVPTSWARMATFQIVQFTLGCVSECCSSCIINSACF